MKNHIYHITLIFFLTAFVTEAQQPYSIHLAGKNGLPIGAVYDIIQDKNGFIWLTGNEGLMRYDGFATINYKSSAQTSMPGSCLKEDVFGRIWYENFDGYIYYSLNDSLYKLDQNEPIGFLPFGITDSLLFCFQKDGIDVFNLSNLKLKKTIQHHLQIPGYSCGDEHNYYFIANDNNLYCVNEKLQIVKSNYPLSDLKNVRQIYTTKDEVYIVSKTNESGSALVFNKDLSFKRKLKIDGIEFIQGSTFIDNDFWFYTPYGAYAFNSKNNKPPKSYFNSVSISKIFKDRQQNYWFATTNDGIYLVPEIENKIFPIREHIPSKIETTSSGTLLGCKDGTIILLDSSFSSSKEVYSSKDKMQIAYLFYDSLSHHLFFTTSKGFVIASKETGKTISAHISLKEAKRLDNKYYAIAVSGFCGLLLNPESNEEIVSFWDTFFKPNDILPGTNLKIAKLKDNLRAKSVDYCEAKKEVCFATNLGLFRYNSSAENEIRKDGQTFYAEKVAYLNDELIVLDAKGNLFSIDDKDQFVLLNKKFNIDLFSIKRMKEVGNKLYLITPESVYYYEPEKKSVSRLHLSINPMLINDIIEKGDQLLLLTNDGVIKMSVYSKYSTHKQPAFLINRVTVNGKQRKKEDLNTLTYKENELEINYSILDYGSVELPELFYQLNENEWTRISNETRNLKFNALSPGKYTIKFKLNNQETDEINFTIKPPFWLTWWFNVLIAFIAIGALLIYFKKRTNSMNKQIRLLNEKIILEKNLNKTMLTAVKSQMNPHFFYNALNTIQAYIFTNDKTKANSYLAKFSKLTRIILEMSEKETISLSEEIEALKLYLDLEKMRFSDSFYFNILAEGIHEKENIEFPPMLIQPFVENAVKHGLLHKTGDKYLEIRFIKSGNMLDVIIDDNGVGRKHSAEINKNREEKYKSFSTQANEKRLSILNRYSAHKVGIEITDKYDSHNNAEGTMVTISIPIN